MYVIVTYDVSTQTREGRNRLRKVARVCEAFGVRVQNSVFELSVEPDQWVECRGKLARVVEAKEDSLRFYFLGSNWRRRVEHIGRSRTPDVESPLIV
jgi:CRISPR-associated protein Cas2